MAEPSLYALGYIIVCFVGGSHRQEERSKLNYLDAYLFLDHTIACTSNHVNFREDRMKHIIYLTIVLMLAGCMSLGDMKEHSNFKYSGEVKGNYSGFVV